MTNAESVLLDVLQNVAKKENYEKFDITVKAISSGGANYTSVLFLATISAPDKEDLKLFAKVANISETTRSQMPFDLFDAEQFAYTDLIKTYKALEDKYEVPQQDRLVFAKFYGCNSTLHEETVVLEDLMAKGYQTYDRMKSVDWPYASKAMEVLAKFHALSISYIENKPEKFDILKEHFKFNNSTEISELMTKLAEKSITTTRKENRERLQKYVEMNEEFYLKFLQTLKRPMLIHGDYRPSNLMHRTNEDGTIDLIAVDLQTLRVGCPIWDVMYFIFTGSDGAFRARYYRQLLEHYYTQLRRALRALRLDPDKLYPRDDFDYELKEYEPCGLMIAMCFLATITVEAENAPSFNEDSGINAIVIEKPSALFSQRLNEIVDDYIRWDVI